MQIRPAQRLLNRRTSSLLRMSSSLLKPSVPDEDVTHSKLCLRQQQQARYYNRSARDLESVEPRDTVRVKPFQTGKKEWKKGVVKSRLDNRSYKVEIPHGILRRNRVHLRKTNEPPPRKVKVEDDHVTETREETPVPPAPETREETREQPQPEIREDARLETRDQPPPETRTASQVPASPVKVPRRSQRIRQAPKRFQDYALT